MLTTKKVVLEFLKSYNYSKEFFIINRVIKFYAI